MINITEKKLRAAIQIELAAIGIYNEKLEDNLVYNIKALSIPVVIGSAKLCSHKCDDDKLPYLKYMDFVKSENAKGNVQKQCNNCKRWFFPSEF